MSILINSLFYFLNVESKIVELVDILLGNSVLTIEVEQLFLYKFFFIIVGLVFYSLILDSSKFQGSIGKNLTQLKVISEEYKRLSIVESIIRNLSKLISYSMFGFGVIRYFINKDRKTWHDKISRTLVVKR